MRVLLATADTQGDRDTDFHWTVDGELLCFGIGELPDDPIHVCKHDQIDGACGCKRSMVGMESRNATTTILVADRQITEDAFRWSLAQSLINSKLRRYFLSHGAFDRHVETHAAALQGVANQWEPGTILERRGDRFLPRR